MQLSKLLTPLAAVTGINLAFSFSATAGLTEISNPYDPPGATMSSITDANGENLLEISTVAQLEERLGADGIVPDFIHSDLSAFDSNNDGDVSFSELKAGLDPNNDGNFDDGPITLVIQPTGSYYISDLHNDDGNLGSPTDSDEYSNIGERHDGLLNGEGNVIPEDELKALADFVDADGDGSENDPGWIHLANIQFDDKAETSTTDYSSISGTTGITMGVADLLSIDFTCDKDSECTSGTWTIDTQGDSIFDSLDALGLGDSIFDNLVFTFKSGNQPKGTQANDENSRVVLYEFDFTDITDALTFDEDFFSSAYDFSGTWNTGDLSLKGLSHANAWVHDPLVFSEDFEEEIPSPAPLALLGIGFAVMGLSRFKGTRFSA
jgi:hypothetical protein